MILQLDFKREGARLFIVKAPIHPTLYYNNTIKKAALHTASKVIIMSFRAVPVEPLFPIDYDASIGVTQSTPLMNPRTIDNPINIPTQRATQ